MSRPRAPSAGELIGRDALIDGALAIIEGGARLLTLRGTVGAGKARVAAAIAARLIAVRRIAAVRSVALRGIDDRAAIERALGDAIRGLRAPACLVLEGCEDGREHVVRWLEARLASDEMLVIATSRVRLGLAVEHVVAVEPLAEDDAIALFGVLSAAARGEVWEEAPDAVHEVRALVRRLGALPLVLELAAAQASALSVRDLLARRDVALDLLASPHPRPRPSEATLRDAVEGALTRLDPGALRALEACATFEGSFVLEDVEAILAAMPGPAPRPIARELARLADASLVAVTRPGAEAWLSVHPPIRLLARERAGPRRAALQSAWAARVRDAARSLAEGPPVVHARSPLARFHEDLLVLAADDQAHTRDPDDVAVRALALLARTRGPIAETIAALDRACARAASGDDDARLARLRHLRSALHRRAGDLTRARDDLDAAERHAARADDAALAIRIEIDRANLRRHVGEDDAARAGYDRALEACRREHDAIGEGLALGALAAMAHERGDLAEATRRYAEIDRVSEELVRRGDDATALATVHHNAGLLLAERGDLAGAERAYRRALAEHRASGDRRFEGIAEHDLGCLALERREVAAARAHFARAEPIAREVGDRRELGLCRARLGICEAMLGDRPRAERSLASAAALLEGAGEPALLGTLAVSRAHLAVAELRLLQQRGEPLPSALVDEVRGALADGGPSAAGGDELRLARRILAADAALALRTDRIVVAPDGAWFSTPRSGRVSLARKATLARLLAALVVASVERPGSSLSAEALARAGWPATRALSPSAKNRLHVAITALRKLGLGDALARDAEGYRLLDVDLGARSATP